MAAEQQSTKSLDVCGIGDAIFDAITYISEEELKSLGLRKGSMDRITQEERNRLLAFSEQHEVHYRLGGSVSTTLFTVARLGGHSALVCSVGSDIAGEQYQERMEHAGVRMYAARHADSTTGLCIIYVTPDAERTMRTHLGAAELLSSSHLHEDVVAASRWLATSAYEFRAGNSIVSRSLILAQKHQTRFSFSVGDLRMVQLHREAIANIIPECDLFIINEEEAKVFTQTNSLDDALEALYEISSDFVLTVGELGAHYRMQGEEGHVPAFQCQPIDLTGAGDTFLGALLFGLCQDLSPRDAIRRANYMSMQVITRLGSRLPSHAKKFWEDSAL